MEPQRGILVSGRGKKGGITLGEGKSQSLESESRIGPSLAVLIQATVLTFLCLSFLPCGWSWNSNGTTGHV